MAKEALADDSSQRYECVPLSELPQGRRGKHHKLVTSILRELTILPAASAMKIPLKELGGVTLANLRSAVHRASVAENLSVGTSSDEHHFYIWKAAG
jgi:hypothetical protein